MLNAAGLPMQKPHLPCEVPGSWEHPCTAFPMVWQTQSMGTVGLQAWIYGVRTNKLFLHCLLYSRVDLMAHLVSQG